MVGILSLSLLLNLLPFSYFPELLKAFGNKNELINIYTTQCITSVNADYQNGWWNAEKAQGEPDLPPDATIQSFNDSNSAFYNGGEAQLICQRFSLGENYITNSTPVDNSQTDNVDLNIDSASTTEASDNIIEGSMITEPADLDSASGTPEIDVRHELQNILDNNNTEEITGQNTEEVIMSEENTEPIIEIEEAAPADNGVEIIETPETTAPVMEVIPESALPTGDTSEPVSFLNKVQNKLSSLFKNQSANAQENTEIKAKELKEIGTFVDAKIKISYAQDITSEPVVMPAVDENALPDNTSEEIIQGNPTSMLIDKIFATKEAEAQDASSSDLVSFWYTIEPEGENQFWQQLGTISRQDLSNALNGGYASFSAPLLDSWEKVNDLKIKAVIQLGDEIATVYIDSLWVEANYEANDNNKKIIKEQTLNDAMEFISNDYVFKQGEMNEMRFRYHKKKNLFATLGDLIGLNSGSENFWNNIKLETKVVNAFGNEIDLPLIVIFSDDGEITVKFPEDEIIKPGAYKLKIIVEDSSSGDLELFEYEKEFSWGVLAINANKGAYLQGEDAFLQMAVLNEFGHTVCDADLDLIITAPDGTISDLSTANGLIERNPECGPDNIIDTPDYSAHYPVSMVGDYALRLIASSTNGLKEITDSIYVRSDVPYGIERIGPTRINPIANYDMTLLIKANNDFQGSINDYIPTDFAIPAQNVQIKKISADDFENYNLYATTSDQYQFNIIPDGDEIRLSWQNIRLLSGEILKIVYTFDAPNISPELYMLGPVEIGDYQDLREWQIASDAVSAIIYNNGSSVNWTNPSYAWNSTDDTYAYRTIPRRSANDSANYLQASANNATDIGGSITKVEIGVEGYTANTAVATNLIPRFYGVTIGSTYTITGATMGTSDGDTTKYVDITSDANASSTWTWEQIQNLDFRLYGLNSSNSANYILYIDQFRVQVTYTPNNAPTGSFSTVVFRADASGVADVAIEVDDAEDNNVQAKLEYVAGSDCNFTSPSDPTIDTTDSNTIADYGDPKIDNNQTYQIGSSTGWIITSSGSNTVNFDWDTLSDLPAANDTYCLRLTANDGYADQTPLATTTVVVDNVAPTSPGVLSKSKAVRNSIDLNFGTVTTESNFKEYKIFWKQYDGTAPTESDNVISSTTDADLGAKNFNDTATTTVSGLEEYVQYSFNIWAYDNYGHKSSSSAVNITTNRAPDSKFNSAVQRNNGTGIVDISVDINDLNHDDAQAKMEYVAGAGCNFTTPLDPILDETQTNISSTYGIVKIDNDNAYQIGNSSGWILTSATNTVQFDWMTLPGLETADDTYCLRLTANDQSDDQSYSSTYTFTLDNAAPANLGALTAGGVASSSITLNFGTAATDSHFQRYRIYYKQGTSGVTTADIEHSDNDLLAADYNNTTNTTITGLLPDTDYVFNIWAYDNYGNYSSASEITLKTNATTLNNSLTFTNPFSANYAIANNTTIWNFRAIVTNDNGYTDMNYIDLRLADELDNSSPFNDIQLRWTQSTNAFSEVGADTNNAITLSPTSVANCVGVTCTLDFKIIINANFATSSQNYTGELYSISDESVYDFDSYSNIYQVKGIKLKQIHYRWRNNNGAE